MIIRGKIKMANSKVIIVEGAQGAGKTTITDFLRYSIKYTNLYHFILNSLILCNNNIIPCLKNVPLLS